MKDARGSASDSVGEGLLVLREQLRINPVKGFELEMLGRLLRSEAEEEPSLLPVLRVAIVSGFTSEPLANAMRVALLAIGFRAKVYEAPFGVYRQEILSSNSGLYVFDPQVILIVAPTADVTNMPERPMPQGDVDIALNSEVEQWKSVWAEIKKKSDAIILQHTFEIPDSIFLGIADRRAAWGSGRFIAELNQRLIEESAGSVRWVDVENLAGLVGRNNWHDPRLKHYGKFAFSPKYLPEYCKQVEGVLRIALACSRKALILDLDNTLWGGVIGDDGLDGIQLGPDSPEGEAYLALCRYVGDLGRRGVILGICSKNEMENVAELFEKHRYMPLSLDEFAVVRCNWEDKASNLTSIASELNIDLSGIVFVDDNPAECELVRQKLPEVTVINLDGDPALFVRMLDRQHLFDSPGLTTEDLRRAGSYGARAKAVELQAQAPDIESYLRSLEMVGTIIEPGRAEIPRMAQMEMKTNQFNLTTRRLSQEQIEHLIENPDAVVLALSLADRFTDHGLVSHLVAIREGDILRISDWLMSCRVFSRTAEDLMLNTLVMIAEAKGASAIVGEFRPTKKNAVVVDLYSKMGFSAMAGESGRWWHLPIKSATAPSKTFISLAPALPEGQP